MQHPTKKCSVCGEEKPKTEFFNQSGKCKPCYREKDTEFRRSKHGLIARIYNRQRRSSRERNHPIQEYSVKELQQWAFNQEKFHNLHKEWAESGYNVKKTPSCDRLDDYKPYTLDNLRIVTWEENDKKFHHDRKAGINNKTNKAVLQLSLKGEVLNRFHSMKEAERVTGIYSSGISACVNGIQRTACGFKWAAE